jgi:hypothetical protein
VGEANQGVGGWELFVARESVPSGTELFFHNLDLFAREIQRDYFPRHLSPIIQWGKSIGRKKRHSIRLGSYHRPSRLIRIHPRLNSADVPHFFVKSIVYHEYLHHVLGPNHNRRFQRCERKFRYYREAKQWLRRHLPVLLGHRASPLPVGPRRARHGGASIQLALFH